MSIDGLSLSFLINELNSELSGGRIEKIFQPDSYTLLIWVRQTGKDLPLVISANPSRPRICLTENIPENPASPPNFCMLLRKHLEDARIAQISQHSLDRIITISADTRGAGGLIVTKELIVELMGKHSNIILTLDNKIIDSIKRVGFNTSSYRQVLPGRDYSYPPGQDRLNILDTPASAFIGRVTGDGSFPKKNLSKELIAAAMGIGPFTAKEIAWRAGLSADINAGELDTSDQNSLCEAVDSIIKPLKSGQVRPTVILDTKPDGEADGNSSVNIPIIVTAFELEHLRQKHCLKNFESMNTAVDFFYRYENKGRTLLPSRDSLAKFIAGEILKLSRKKTAISQELSDAENGDRFRRLGDILMANLYNVPPGSSSVVLADIYSDASGEEITVELDPRLSVAANAQGYYSKYNKSKRALENLSRELKLCLEEIEYLESVDLSLDQAQTSQEILDIRRELIAANYLKETTKGQKRLPSSDQSYLTARTSDGYIVLVGKNNRQNDLVTFKHSHPEDIWLHTKDIPGSHVILKTNKQKLPAQSLEKSLSEAAQIAAYFSKARQSANVPVDYTLRRFVRKPAGAKPGFVYYEKQTTLYVTPVESVILKLLEKD